MGLEKSTSLGVPDHVMESISGHLSRRMLEHYSHIRLEAKRKALEELDARRGTIPPAKAPLWNQVQ